MLKINEIDFTNQSPIFIVLEAGPTHTGLDSAKKLVDVAVESGANAIKFQYMNVDRLMADKKVPFSYRVITEKNEIEEVTEPLYDILKRREMPKGDWKKLKKYCDGKGIVFFSTAMFEEDVDFLVDELEITSIKLASADINHLGLIEYMANKQINIQVDTGSADIWEIERAISLIEAQGNKNIIIHLCPTGYPARLESIHLNMISTLKQLFPDYPIAFSDHNPGWEMDIAAVALGSTLVEKTITLDRKTKSCEHMFSLEPDEVKRFVKSIREVEVALGEQRRVFPFEEKEKRKSARRSVYLNIDIQEGEIINEKHVDFRRPGFGIAVDDWPFVKGRKVKQLLNKGHQLKWSDLV
ncbi:N-acetylneuraminate synthase family protein [Halalkalibacter flavus]|uniref:N-acetylneuraminate synthase family protein n=1 Tax=Halalkalibacter flavus TaxID=3090668 RepID=UPI002FCBA814